MPRAADAYTTADKWQGWILAEAGHGDDWARVFHAGPEHREQNEPMAVVREITVFDRVELLEPVDDARAGARGGVLELRDGDTAMVEITTPKLDAAARIVFVRLAKLRRVA